jgi:hypothetical protein
MKREKTKSIGEAISAYVQESNLGEGLMQARICGMWDALTIGQLRLGEYTSRRTFRAGVLSCKMKSSVVRAHLQFQLEDIRTQLNKQLGSEYIQQIKLS